jgi:hypothetical protein
MRIGILFSLPGIMILTTLTALTGCNIFNPGGGGDRDSVCKQDDADCHMTLGQDRLGNKNFAGAMRSFERAIAADSTRSLAYYSYAKAVGFRFNVVRAQVLTDLANTVEEGPMAFLGYPDEELTNRLQAASRVRRTLAILTDRDTLTHNYNLLGDSSAAALNDPHYDERVRFMEQYLIEADLGSEGYRKRSEFPLSDHVMRSEAVVLDYTTYELLHTITQLYDLDGNDTIDARDEMMKKLIFNKDGTFGNLDEIASDLEDSATAANFNTLIQNMQSGLTTSSQLAQVITPSESGNASDKASDNMDSVITNLGDAILFYQFGDGKDNDGDGCIDEEVLDELDNDGDGFVDEDARTFYTPTNLGAGRHDNRGSSGDTVGTTTFRDTLTVNFVSFVHQFYQDNPDPDSNFIKIKKGDEMMDFRLRIQQDSLTQRSAAELAGPLAAKLDSAKALIGGCWRYYP